MAKVLDALERARQQRMKKLREATAAQDASLKIPGAAPGSAVKSDPSAPPAPHAAQATVAAIMPAASRSQVPAAAARHPAASPAAAPLAQSGAVRPNPSPVWTPDPPAAPSQAPLPTQPATSAPFILPAPVDSAASQAGKMSDKILAAYDPQAPVAEQLRQIRTNLETALAAQKFRPIVITSPVPGDGKSLIAANLAAVLADDPSQQVAIVDADMRKGDQHQLFANAPAPGLSEYLRGLCSLDEVIRATDLPNLKLIPAGRAPDKPTVLLGSARMATLLAELKRTFSWVVFDTPPLLPVTDALILGRESAGLILVVRMDRTSRHAIARAQDLVANARLPMLGCILNDFMAGSREGAGYHHYYRRSGT